MTTFTSRVSSGGLINIPQNVRDMNQFEQGDLLEVKVIKHKKEGGEIVQEDQEETHEVTTNE